SYKVPAGQTAVTLTFKLVDNQTQETSSESLTITLTSAKVTENNTTQDIELGTSVATTVTIKNDSLNVKWQTITGTDANKTTLSADADGRGQRVFPEKTTPTGEIANKFELVFELEAAATAATTLYFKILDPDNFIGLGNNDNNATAWAGNDNYATLSVLTSVTIAANATSATLTIVAYPAGYTGTKLTGNATTIIIDSAHAGDNFIVVVDTDQAKVNAAALGTTQDTRYKENNKLTQSELLTVWRTLNVELDVASWTNMPAGNLKAPLDGLVATELARACIVTREFTPNNTVAPNVGDNGVNKNEDDKLLGTDGTNQSGRDLPANSKDFWTVRIVTIPYYNYGEYNDDYGAFTPTTNTIAICYEEISDDVMFYNASDKPDIDLNDSLRQNVLHEIGHVLLTGLGTDHTGDDNNHTTPTVTDDVSIMTQGVGSGFNINRTVGDYRKFLNTQIKDIQQYSRANN
ncbi:MAG: hypothetical protein LBC74_06490, partial [Planctomycetaceae bacterium]|nr:hypothetical protein [Planctomycetaceae bacterium]